MKLRVETSFYEKSGVKIPEPYLTPEFCCDRMKYARESCFIAFGALGAASAVEELSRISIYEYETNEGAAAPAMPINYCPFRAAVIEVEVREKVTN